MHTVKLKRGRPAIWPGGPPPGHSPSRLRLASAALATVGLLLLASPAAAAPPTHPPLPDRGIEGFDHACGLATDPEGNTYVASAGDSEVQIFDADHAPIGTLAVSGEPCGLAVDSAGRLYVSERAAANVLRYTPVAFPFAGAPSYGPPTTIDASGEAGGIAVDPYDDRLYVARGDHIAVYLPDGTPDAVDEEQRVTVDAGGGTYTLSFEGATTDPIAHDAGAATVQLELEALSTIGAGNVALTDLGFGFSASYRVDFLGALAETSLPQLSGDKSSLGLPGFGLSIQTLRHGFNGRLGEGELDEASGVAAYSQKSGTRGTVRHLAVADEGEDELKLLSGFVQEDELSHPDMAAIELRRTISSVDHDGEPGTAPQELGFGANGAYLASDPGNVGGDGKCAQIGAQACTAGHFFLHDAANEAVEEFEANGSFFARVPFAGADAEPTAIAVERSGGPGDGTLLVSEGAGAGARVSAFGPLGEPSRQPRPQASFEFSGAVKGPVAVDAAGNRYVSVDATIFLYGPDGQKIAVKGPNGEDGLVAPRRVMDLDVDSECRVYAVSGAPGSSADQSLVRFDPGACPPQGGTQYAGPETVLTSADFPQQVSMFAVAVNPANDHVFATNANSIMELSAADEGSQILDQNFCAGQIRSGGRLAIDVYGADGSVYVGTGSASGPLLICNAEGTGLQGAITGAGSPAGPLDAARTIAVDQSNGHVVIFTARGTAEEYEPSGAFVAEFGSLPVGFLESRGIAVDSSGGPNDGNVFLSFHNSKLLSAFDRVTYGGPPKAATGAASALSGTEATLNGTVNPLGFEVDSCEFQYVAETAYEQNIEDELPAFTGAATAACAETPAEIGAGDDPVPVQAQVSGLDAAERYRYRLGAANQFGPDLGEARLFGPVLLGAVKAQPVLYDEATLRGAIDPSGLETEYRFEYGTSASYGSSTPWQSAGSGVGELAVARPLIGLEEGTAYHFRLLAKNELGPVQSADHTFTTLSRPSPQTCPNDQYRVGPSAALPDCRAYELVTPADTRGLTPFQPIAPVSTWWTKPRGAAAGGSVTFHTDATLPGFEGSGRFDAYTASRAAGAHPAAGWGTAIFSPSFPQAGGFPIGLNMSSDQRYSFWRIGADGSMAPGTYLRTPSGFESAGRGALGDDLGAEGHFIAEGGARVIFTSSAQLEDDAPPAGTRAIYERAAGEASARVVSLRPDGQPFGAGEDAAFLGASDDGRAVAFAVAGALYVSSAATGTVAVAPAPNTYAGVSDDGRYVYYTTAVLDKTPGSLVLFDVLSEESAEIAADSIFVNVPAADPAVESSGSGPGPVYLTSEEVLDGPGEGTLEADNLYRWDESGTHFIAELDPDDLGGGFGTPNISLASWSNAPRDALREGRGYSPTRTTPGGELLAFQSHAQLIGDETGGRVQVYLYDHSAPTGERILCVSCDPSGAGVPTADATLQSDAAGSGISNSTIVPNLTEDGESLVFQSGESLVPEDANDVEDVYRWAAAGSPGCAEPGGCLALISSGQDERDSVLYSMTPDGHDVFLRTEEKLLGADVEGSPSIYDARVGGGIPESLAAEPCSGDACQGQGSPPPALPAPSTGSPASPPPKARACPRGTRRVKANNGRKARCLRRPAQKRHRGSRQRHRASSNGRTAR